MNSGDGNYELFAGYSSALMGSLQDLFVMDQVHPQRVELQREDMKEVGGGGI